MFATVGNEKVTGLLNDWYKAIRAQRLLQAQQLKEEVDSLIQDMEEDQTLLIYYALLEFRHKLLTNNVGDMEKSLKQIESVKESSDEFLNYYYHFFRAIYLTKMGVYSDARDYFEKAEQLLQNVPDDIEKAEFNYRIAVFFYHLWKPIDAMNYAVKAQALFSKKKGYEINVASCKNIMGLASLTLKQYELAEEYLVSALAILKENNQERLVQKTRHNLGLMYADQKLPHVAIRYLTESEIDNCKTMYLLAREYIRLDMNDKAVEYIEKGIALCEEKNNEEYTHHLAILKVKVDSLGLEILEETICSGINYFKQENLWQYVQEYAEELAICFCEEGMDNQVSKYFRIAYEAKQEITKRGALK